MKIFLTIGCFLAGTLMAEVTPGYDPAGLPDGAQVVVRDVEFRDETRDRVIPLRVYHGKKAKNTPVVLFSHGLGGSRENNGYLGKHWAARGYVVVVMQHAGSDETVWKDVPRLQRMAAMRKAANAANSIDRNKDVKAVLDQLAAWNRDKTHFLFERVDLEKTGMSGHSFGAVTTQAVSGQRLGLGRQRQTDKRIDAALALSPSLPAVGDPAKAFGGVKIPWMLMTGTKDASAIGRTTPEQRTQVFPHLPKGGKYELVLHDAEHMAFSDRTLRGREHRNPNHHKSIIALSTAFWDSYLKGDAAARDWLDGEGARKVLEARDAWRKK
jgi:predicted dienelactone hydrolase